MILLKKREKLGTMFVCAFADMILGTADWTKVVAFLLINDNLGVQSRVAKVAYWTNGVTTLERLIEQMNQAMKVEVLPKWTQEIKRDPKMTTSGNC
jgi:hypothetical protein